MRRLRPLPAAIKSVWSMQYSDVQLIDPMLVPSLTPDEFVIYAAEVENTFVEFQANLYEKITAAFAIPPECLLQRYRKPFPGLLGWEEFKEIQQQVLESDNWVTFRKHFT